MLVKIHNYIEFNSNTENTFRTFGTFHLLVFFNKSNPLICKNTIEKLLTNKNVASDNKYLQLTKNQQAESYY